MRAELILMGKRLDMAPQMHRRTLVMLIYATLALAMVGLWFLDRWRVTGVYMIFATILVNRLLLGGYNFGGLIKPFSGKAPSQRVDPPPFLALGLRLYRPEPEQNEYRNDERELQQRDHAHYSAYQGLALGLVLIWLIADWQANAPRLLGWLFSWLPGGPAVYLYGLTLAVVVVSQTLPQAILLWTEPDMEEPDLVEFGAESAL
jgi:hypothetical protein